MSKLISKLPKRIRDRALECQKRQGITYDVNDEVPTFLFDITDEGEDIWWSVVEGNYTPFYTFHNIKPHGGKRKNAGRPLKYGEETTEVTYYPPLSKKPIIDKMVKDKLKEWVVKSGKPSKVKPLDRFPCDDEQHN